jgi:hypothetical protein
VPSKRTELLVVLSDLVGNLYPHSKLARWIDRQLLLSVKED